MGVPFEALLPYGIILGMLGISGYGIAWTQRMKNEGKKPRWNRDLWDRQSKTYQAMNEDTEKSMWANENTVMERDLRITGTERGQSNHHQAPKGFEVNNPWKIEKRIF